MRSQVAAVLLLLFSLTAGGQGALVAGQGAPAATVPAVSPKAIRGGDGIQLPPPPAAEAIPVIDSYFGTKITDNYRWLEDSKSPETREFIEAQNVYADRYFKQAKVRPEFAGNLDALVRVTSWTSPILRTGKAGTAESYFFMKRLSSEEQASIYVRHGLSPPQPGKAASAAGGQAGKRAGNLASDQAGRQASSDIGRDIRLVDPESLSRDANTSVSLLAVSNDANLLIYGVRSGGADEQEVHFLNLTTRKTLEDTLPEARYNSIDFAPDGSGVYYAKFTHTGSLLYFHKFGTRLSADVLLLGREFHGELLGELDMISARVTDDSHYLVVTVSRGVPARRMDVIFRDLRHPDAPFEVLVWDLDWRFSPLYANGEWYVRTDLGAPKGRIVKVSPGVAPQAWETVVAEGPDVMDGATLVGNRLFVHRLKDVKAEMAIYTLAGKPIGRFPYEGIGNGSGLSGRITDRYGFYSFESLIEPPTIYRYDTMTGKQEIFAQVKTPFDPGEFEVKQVFFESKDKTRVPMFIAGRKGLKMDGSERLMMTGYGGFNASEMPDWSPLYAAWMQQGGWFALPSLRGGGEYGEGWHEQGMFGKKQNVFDDFAAAAEYLIAGHYTSAAHLAISGRSNAGLLVGATMTQRPELFSAVWCGYPLLDMLRYQKFEMGRLWTTEYGSAENEKEFPYLRKYSPYENVKPGTKYPAIFFFSGESDTRVDPLHARKMTALMQSASASARPVLLHYSLKGGHSAGVSAAQLIDDYTDQLTFLWTETGMGIGR